jgi:hypothetical protein
MRAKDLPVGLRCAAGASAGGVQAVEVYGETSSGCIPVHGRAAPVVVSRPIVSRAIVSRAVVSRAAVCGAIVSRAIVSRAIVSRAIVSRPCACR